MHFLYVLLRPCYNFKDSGTFSQVWDGGRERLGGADYDIPLAT